MSKAKTALITF